MKWLKSYLSLKFIGYAFTDKVNGKPVYYFKDCYGDYYMKHGRYSLFSVKANETSNWVIADNQRKER